MEAATETRKGSTHFQWIFALLANIALFDYGLESGWISPSIKSLQSENSPTGYPLSSNMMGWIASSLSIAATFGVLLYSYIADTFGRKFGIILISVLHAICWIIKLVYTSAATLIIARLITGLAAGGCFIVVPMYVKEISQDNIRGILGTFTIVMQTTGLLVAYLLGAYLEYFTVIKVIIALPIVLALLFTKAPESPAFLVKQGKFDEATKTIALLRGFKKDDKIVQTIVDTMKNEDAYFKSLPKLTIVGILKNKPWRRGCMLITGIFICHAMNGAVVIVTYACSVLASTGVKFDISPEIQVISFPVVMIFASITLTVIVERCGRKILLFGVFLISACSMATIAILIVVQKQGGYVPPWLPVVAMVLSVAMYGGGVAPLPYIIMTEMFCFQIRAKVVGTVITLNWFLTSIIITLYTPLANSVGPHSPFIFYAIMNLTGAIFTIIFIPETRGKGEDEILKMLSKGKTDTENSISNHT